MELKAQMKEIAFKNNKSEQSGRHISPTKVDQCHQSQQDGDMAVR